MSVAKCIEANPVLNGCVVVQPNPSASNDFVVLEDRAEQNLPVLDHRFKGGPWLNELSSLPAGTGDIASSNGGNASLTYGAVPGFSHALYGCEWSYSADPASGNLTVKDGNNTVFSEDITNKGPGFFSWEKGLRGSPNTNYQVILASGGAGVVARLNLGAHHRVE